MKAKYSIAAYTALLLVCATLIVLPFFYGSSSAIKLNIAKAVASGTGTPCSCGSYSCGSCISGYQTCYPGNSGCSGCNSYTQQCCAPQCSGLQCGPDGCGGSCGSCSTGSTCSSGKCVQGNSSCAYSVSIMMSSCTASSGCSYNSATNSYTVPSGYSPLFLVMLSPPQLKAYDQWSCTGTYKTAAKSGSWSNSSSGGVVLNIVYPTLSGSWPYYQNTIQMPAQTVSTSYTVTCTDQNDKTCTNSDSINVNTVCTPKTCSQLSIYCGSASDGCGGTLSCGTCTSGQTCTSGKCVCTPKTCSQLGFVCGSASDTCGGTLSCGTCPSGKICNTTTDQCNSYTPVCTKAVVTPSNASVAVGGQQQYSASYTDQTGLPMSSSSCPTSWFTSNSAVASIDMSSGLATGVSAGSATITASSGNAPGSVGSVPITVTAAATLVTVSVASPTVAVGAGDQATMKCTQGGKTVSCAGSWSTSNANATVSNSGLVTGVTPGTVNVIYTISTGGSGSATITVTSAGPTLGSMAWVKGGSTITSQTVTTGGTDPVDVACKDKSGSPMTCPAGITVAVDDSTGSTSSRVSATVGGDDASGELQVTLNGEAPGTGQAIATSTSVSPAVTTSMFVTDTSTTPPTVKCTVNTNGSTATSPNKAFPALKNYPAIYSQGNATYTGTANGGTAPYSMSLSIEQNSDGCSIGPVSSAAGTVSCSIGNNKTLVNANIPEYWNVDASATDANSQTAPSTSDSVCHLTVLPVPYCATITINVNGQNNPDSVSINPTSSMTFTGSCSDQYGNPYTFTSGGIKTWSLDANSSGASDFTIASPSAPATKVSADNQAGATDTLRFTYRESSKSASSSVKLVISKPNSTCGSIAITGNNTIKLGGSTQLSVTCYAPGSTSEAPCPNTPTWEDDATPGQINATSLPAATGSPATVSGNPITVTSKKVLGTDTITATVTGCNSPSNSIAIFTAKPVITCNTVDASKVPVGQTQCQAAMANAPIGGGGSWSWDPAGGTQNDAADSSTSTVTYNDPQKNINFSAPKFTYYSNTPFVPSSTCSCAQGAKPLPTVTCSTTPTSGTVVSGNSFTVTATNITPTGATLSWTVPAGAVNPGNNPSHTYTSKTPGTYTFTVTATDPNDSTKKSPPSSCTVTVTAAAPKLTASCALTDNTNPDHLTQTTQGCPADTSCYTVLVGDNVTATTTTGGGQSPITHSWSGITCSEGNGGSKCSITSGKATSGNMKDTVTDSSNPQQQALSNCKVTFASATCACGSKNAAGAWTAASGSPIVCNLTPDISDGKTVKWLIAGQTLTAPVAKLINNKLAYCTAYVVPGTFSAGSKGVTASDATLTFASNTLLPGGSLYTYGGTPVGKCLTGTLLFAANSGKKVKNAVLSATGTYSVTCTIPGALSQPANSVLQVTNPSLYNSTASNVTSSLLNGVSNFFSSLGNIFRH